MTITFNDLELIDVKRAVEILEQVDYDSDLVINIQKFKFDFTFQYDDLESVVISYA